MKTDPALAPARAGAQAQRFAVPRLYTLAGLTILAWMVTAAAIAALWSLVQFITA